MAVKDLLSQRYICWWCVFVLVCAIMCCSPQRVAWTAPLTKMNRPARPVGDQQALWDTWPRLQQSHWGLKEPCVHAPLSAFSSLLDHDTQPLLLPSVLHQLLPFLFRRHCPSLLTTSKIDFHRFLLLLIQFSFLLIYLYNWIFVPFISCLVCKLSVTT